MPASTCCSHRPRMPSSHGASRSHEAPRSRSWCRPGRRRRRRRGCRRSGPSAGRSWCTRAARPVGRRASCTRTPACAAQIDGLVEPWAWSADDRILLVLPLHHVHGIVNVVCCALWSRRDLRGAGRLRRRCTSWERFAVGRADAVHGRPDHLHAASSPRGRRADPATQARWSAGAAELRLMVSGSAALPVSMLDRWREISGHVLLERYGMTEIGMAPVEHADEPRCPATSASRSRRRGATRRRRRPRRRRRRAGRAPRARARSVFLEYWNRPEETRAAFVDGWFRTGDVAVRDPAGYRILGRSSVDIIKTRRREGLGARDRGGVPRPTPTSPTAPSSACPTPSGASGCAPPSSREPGHGADRRRVARWGEGAARRRTRCRRASSSSTTLPRNAMGKVTKPRVSELFAEE